MWNKTLVETCGAGSVVKQTTSVVKRHRFDIEWAENRFFVDETAVLNVWLARGQNDAHWAQVDFHRTQVSTVQRRALCTQRAGKEYKYK